MRECVIVAELPEKAAWLGKLGCGNTETRSTAKQKFEKKQDVKWIGTHGKLRLSKTAIHGSCAMRTTAAGSHQNVALCSSVGIS